MNHDLYRPIVRTKGYYHYNDQLLLQKVSVFDVVGSTQRLTLSYYGYISSIFNCNTQNVTSDSSRRFGIER